MASILNTPAAWGSDQGCDSDAVSNYSLYEHLKSEWTVRNPGASAEQHEQAMRAIAAEARV